MTDKPWNGSHMTDATPPHCDPTWCRCECDGAPDHTCGCGCPVTVERRLQDRAEGIES